MKKDNTIYLSHILESIKNIETYTKGFDISRFKNSRIRQDAVFRNLEIVGEAVKNIDARFKIKHTQVDWRKIAGLRDKLIHEYFGVDVERVWQIIKKDIPKLKKEITKLLK